MNRVEVDTSRLRLPPGYSASVWDYGGNVSVGLTAPPRVCADCELDPCDCHGHQPTLEEYQGECQTNDPHLAVMVTYLEDAFHEALEWITLDGARWVSAHGDAVVWDIVHGSLMSALVDIRKRESGAS